MPGRFTAIPMGSLPAPDCVGGGERAEGSRGVEIWDEFVEGTIGLVDNLGYVQSTYSWV